MDDWRGVVESSVNWLALDADERFELVKSNPVRRVWRGALDGRGIYVKEFLDAGFGCTIRKRVRGSAARAEWRIARAAEQHGVPAVRYVALGESRGRSYLVSIEIPEAMTLRDAWLRGDADTRRALLRATARLLAVAHDAGFLHGDEHSANILVRPEIGGGATAIYADLAKGSVVAKVTDQLASRSLAQINQWFRRRSGLAFRLRFFVEYCRRRADRDRKQAREWVRRLAPLVFKTTHQQAQVLWSKRDRRIFATNRYFAEIDAGDGRRAHVVLSSRQRDLFPAPSWDDWGIDEWRARFAERPNEERIEIRSSTDEARLRSGFERSQRLRNRDLPCRWTLAFVAASSDRPAALWVDRNPETQRLGALSRSVVRSLADLAVLMADRGATFAGMDVRTLGVDRRTSCAVIEDVFAVDLHARDFDRDLRRNCLALYRYARSNRIYRRVDAVRFLKRVDRRRWRRFWNCLADIVRGHSE